MKYGNKRIDMEEDDLEEGEISDDGDDDAEKVAKSQNSTEFCPSEPYLPVKTQPFSGYWKKMQKSNDDTKTSIESQTLVKSPRSSVSSSSNSIRRWTPVDKSKFPHPLDPLSDFDSRIHQAGEWGDVDLRLSYTRRRPKKSSVYEKQKATSTPLHERTPQPASVNKSHASPENEVAEDQEELLELQLRMDALKSSLKKKMPENVDVLNEGSSFPKPSRIRRQSSTLSKKQKKKQNYLNRLNSKRFRSSQKRPQQPYISSNSEYRNSQNRNTSKKLNYEEQVKEFIKTNKVSTSYPNVEGSSHGYCGSLSSSTVNGTQPSSLQDNEISNSMIYVYNLATEPFRPSPSISFMRSRQPLLPIPPQFPLFSPMLPQFAQFQNSVPPNTLISIPNFAVPPPLLNRTVSPSGQALVAPTPQIACLEDEQSPRKYSPPMLNEEVPDVLLDEDEKKNEVGLVSPEEEDEEELALREVLLMSIKKKATPVCSEKMNSITEKVTASTSSEVKAQIIHSYSSPIVEKSKDVFVTINSGGSRNVKIEDYLSSSTTKSEQKRFVVSAASDHSGLRTVSSSHVNNSPKSPISVNRFRANQRMPLFIDHKPVLIPLNDDSSSSSESESDSECLLVEHGDLGIKREETTLADCLKGARQRADEAKRKQNEAIVEKLEDQLKSCRGGLSKNKESLSEDRKRLRSLESTAAKHKTDLRFAEMKLQKIKEELKKVEKDCAEHRVFIVRVNKEIQKVQNSVDQKKDFQNLCEKQWNEIQKLVVRHRAAVQSRNNTSVKHSEINVAMESVADHDREFANVPYANKVLAKRSLSPIFNKFDDKRFKVDLDAVFESEVGKTSDKTVSKSQTTFCEQKKQFASVTLELSPLFVFKSYRLSKIFVETCSTPLSSLTFCNKIQPNVKLCPFALNGNCYDSNCQWQHECDFKMSEVETIADLLSFCPSLINGRTDGDSIIKCAEGLYASLKDKMSLDEILEEIRQKSESEGVQLNVRHWRPTQLANVNSVELDFLLNSTRTSVEPAEHFDVSSAFVRYYSYDFETSTRNSPNDIDNYINWANVVLNDLTEDSKVAMSNAMKILCRGLEKNKADARLWVTYLKLVKIHHSNDLSYVRSVVRKSLNFAESFEMLWMWWDVVEDLDENKECFERCMKFCKEQTSSITSNGIVRAVIRMVQYFIKRENVTEAKKVFQNFLDESMKCFDCFAGRHKALLWATFIHLDNLGYLPAELVGFTVSTESLLNDIVADFLIPWNLSILVQEETYGFFELAFECCGLSRNEESWQDCWILYKNRLSLDVKLGRFDAAADLCERLLATSDRKEDFVELELIVRLVQNDSFRIRRNLSSSSSSSMI